MIRDGIVTVGKNEWMSVIIIQPWFIKTEFERAIIFDRRSLDSKSHDLPTIDSEKALLYVV
jgi:hypothetical protein